MKNYQLTRKDMQNYQDDPGKTTERIVEGEFSDLSRFGVENFDLIDDSDEDGQLAEVKSTQTTLSDGSPGRFRLWKEQHEKLLRADYSNHATYVFVLIDVSDRPLTARIKRRKPASIGNTIGGRGGWNKSGHNEGPQYKLPIDVVF